MDKYNGQANQDRFVLNMLNKKYNGYFLEIGSNHPINYNNSYILEKSYQWKGILVEYDESFLPLYKQFRPNSYPIIGNAITVDYKKILEELQYPKNMDYLQIDLDVDNRSTLDTLLNLNNTIFDEYKFATITFEHDIYRGDFFNTKEISRKIFKDRGYILLFPDVKVFWLGNFQPFEDWYVHPDLVDMKLINKIMSHPIYKEGMNHLDYIKIMEHESLDKPTVIFLNHKQKQCGVYQYGSRVFKILQNSKDINYIYYEISSYNEYLSCLELQIYNSIIYNYHASTMPWLNINNIQQKNQNIVINHESYCNFGTKYIEVYSEFQDTNNRFSIPRPLFQYVDLTIMDSESENIEMKDFIFFGQDNKDIIPIIGSFGFGFNNKGFDRIIRKVNEEFDSAIIKFIIPYAHFGDQNGQLALSIDKICHELNQKPGIKLMIIHSFFDDVDILRFLRSNSINLFLYDEMIGRGNSSTIDYAISAQKPLGIRNSYMFKHIYSDIIDVDKVSIKDCMKKSLPYLQQFNEKWSNDNLKKKMSQIIN